MYIAPVDSSGVPEPEAVYIVFARPQVVVPSLLIPTWAVSDAMIIGRVDPEVLEYARSRHIDWHDGNIAQTQAVGDHRELFARLSAMQRMICQRLLAQ